MALHVDGHRIHRNVRRRELDMHGERRRVASQALRPDAQTIDRGGKLRLELRAVRIGAMRAEFARGRALRERDAEIRRAPDPYANDCRRTRLRTGGDHAIDHERLDSVDAFGGNRHLQKRIVL